MERCLIITVLVGLLVSGCSADNSTEVEACDELYEAGYDAYLDERWIDCINNLQKAIHTYNKFTRVLINCRNKCKQDVRNADYLFSFDIEDLHFYEKTLRNTLCVMKCKKKHNIFKIFELSKETEELFETKKPYEYLHICYFQQKMMQQAASAAFTYLVSHPKDEMMTKNLKYYLTLPEVDSKEIINYEAKDYVYLYAHGSISYNNEDWQAVIENMEESFLGYLYAEEDCRALCEGPFDHGWFPDFISAIANHFTYALKCKIRCADSLNNLNGEEHDDLLPSHFHFLQYAYYKTGQIAKACEAVASYLLFYPDDETMLDNRKYYKKLPKVKDEFFQPRPEVLDYIRRMKYEQKLLKFLNTEFLVLASDRQITTEPNKVESTYKNSSHKLYLSIRNTLENTQRKVKLVRSEADLNGRNRFVAEGIITEEECALLLDLSKFAVPNDGYEGLSPHSKMERFEGITLGRAALLVHFGLLDVKKLEIFLAVSEMGLNYVKQYFDIHDLYINYTHLVCRTALSDTTTTRKDFSHQVHADNCNLLEDNVCTKEFPSYIWRDYSAIVYLNDDFKGGEFIFAGDKSGEIVQSEVKPTCGRMVGFSAGFENLHGVKAVLQGTRCAIGLWFTKKPEHREIERLLALKYLKEVNGLNVKTEKIVAELEKYADGRIPSE